jgi:hypothetical protein
MSRGLRTRQRLFLAGMAKMEDDEGACFYVWQIINSVGELGLADEANARKARKDAHQAEFEEARRQKILKAEALAASGDPSVVTEHQRLLDWEETRRLMRSLVRGPIARMRTPEDADDIANPTRVLGLLERRGLIKRHVHPGRGSYASLTDAGREIGRQALEAMQQA